MAEDVPSVREALSHESPERLLAVAAAHDPDLKRLRDDLAAAVDDDEEMARERFAALTPEPRRPGRS